MQKETSNALIVVAKRPTAGKAKTRLSPPLSPEQASSIYECFLHDTLEQIRRVGDIQRVIAYWPEEAMSYFRLLAPDFRLLLQEGPDLGARLDHAMTTCFSLGYRHVVIMDSDSPTLPVCYVARAFTALSDGADAVLGPCEDGGYYLIGSTRPIPRLLREVRMSTPTVAADTIALAGKAGLRLRQLPVWHDVDDAAALERLAREIQRLEPHFAIHTRGFLNENSIRFRLPEEAEI